MLGDRLTLELQQQAPLSLALLASSEHDGSTTSIPPIFWPCVSLSVCSAEWTGSARTRQLQGQNTGNS